MCEQLHLCGEAAAVIEVLMNTLDQHQWNTNVSIANFLFYDLCTYRATLENILLVYVPTYLADDCFPLDPSSVELLPLPSKSLRTSRPRGTMK